MAKAWYSYIGGPVGSANSYIFSGDFHACVGSGQICIIYSDAATGNQPLLTTNLMNYINAGILAGFTSPIPNPAAGYKPYLYVRF